MGMRAAQLPQFQLALTPALHLSLEVLQMPLAQLQMYLRQQLEDNPLLEAQEEMAEVSQMDQEASAAADRVVQALDDNYSSLWRQADSTNGEEEDEPTRQDAAAPMSLYEHLLTQLRCQSEEPVRLALAERLLAWLDPDGYLRHPLKEVAEQEQDCTEADLEAALGLIHRLEPPGVGARTVGECLAIQLCQRGQAGSLACRIVRDHFAMVTGRKFRELAVKLNASPAEVEAAYHVITTLDPRPARNFSVTPVAMRLPDLIIRRDEGGWIVELNDQELPNLRVSSHYRALLKDGGTPEEAKQFVRERVNQAIWIMKAIDQRHQTMLSIGRTLIELEREYLEHGISRLVPLTQELVAQRVGCHPSTVSRAIAGKSVQTPYGLVPLEDFFGGGIATTAQNGRGAMAAKTVQAELRELVAQEPTARPLSDDDLAKHLADRGYPVARRTVAKYRSALKILPAHLRKNAF